MNERQQPPRRIFRLTITRADGSRHWRYIRCPYKTVGASEWADSLVGMQNDLADLTLNGVVDRFAISAVPAENTHNAATRSMRWHEFRLIAVPQEVA